FRGRARPGHGHSQRLPEGGHRLEGRPPDRVPKHAAAGGSGDVHIAYQVLGDGPFDLVHIPGFVSHLVHAWEEPSLARFYQRLSSFSRLILFDKRGTVLSDRVSE